MKLNHECIRDVLLYIENHCIYEENDRGYTNMHLVTNLELFNDEYLSSNYDEDTVQYTVAQLFLDNMIIGKYRTNSTIFHMNDCDIESLSPKGHEFLDTIRDDNIWKKTKEHVSKLLSSASISTISQVASKIAISVLTKQL